MSKDNVISVTIDSNPKMLKPILFTTYDTVTKYNLHITYEDSTTKDIELVQNDKDRLYQFVFKREGKLIKAIGIPTVHEINETSSFCDFANRIMDSNDLLIELDCSSEYDCTKVRFYLKDVRDIIDLANEEIEEPEDPIENAHTMYPIYLNGFSCEHKISYFIPQEHYMPEQKFRVFLKPTVATNTGVPLLKNEYSDLDIHIENDTIDDLLIKMKDTDDDIDLAAFTISKDLLDTEIEVLVEYYINKIEHPVFDKFVIIPTIKEEPEAPVLTRAVTTQDPQYRDGIKPVLGAGITPGYKSYRNSKNRSKSIMDK